MGKPLNLDSHSKTIRGDEKQLILRAASGDSAAFEQIYQRYRDRVYGFAYRMISDSASAEDVTQDVLLTLIEHPERYDPGRASLITFLCTIARCKIIDQLRRNANGQDLTLWCDENGASLQDEQSDSSPFEQLLKGEVERLVAAAITALPPLQRETLLLREYERLSYEEIAAVVGTSINVVRARLHRARRSLAARLAPVLDGNGVKDYGLRNDTA